ncbi:MAG: nuclear transport factor 2 family protein [Rhodothermaceae bacterium]|nr:nuclear transport factor 2 family protein [Rhodothermaceae bacterium]
MASILEMTQDLVRLGAADQLLDAVNTYYADDVTITESTGETAQGRETQLDRMKQFEASIGEMHGGGVHAITANEDQGVSMVESWIDATFADGSRRKLEEVERYRWQDGKIVDARFYYATGSPAE